MAARAALVLLAVLVGALTLLLAQAGETAVVRTAGVPHQPDWFSGMLVPRPARVSSGAFAGGALVANQPDGDPMPLQLRKYLVDVYIEDGFARTTIDQTFFNQAHVRLDGTFYFPLPPDASL